MPSEDRALQALRHLAPSRDAFRSAAAEAADTIRALVESHQSGVEARVARTRLELGAFAHLHIDAAGFAELLDRREALEPRALPVMRQALAVLQSLLSAGDDLFVLNVPAGADLRDAIAAALANAGRAFAAAHAVDMVRARPDAVCDETLFAPYAPHRWNRAERTIAPPLVVRVAGEDMRIGGVEEFLQGGQKLVLLVEGRAPAAALVRLITPGTFVMQSAQLDDVERLARSAAPGIAAVIAEDAAEFVHDPAVEHGSRVTLTRVPATPAHARLGRISALQQFQELEQLLALAALPEPAAEGAKGHAETSAPADLLAAWLLRQADLTTVTQ